MQTLQKMLELDLMLLVISQKDHYRKEKNENVTGLIKPELGGKIMIEFAALRPKGTKRCIIKRKLKFEDYKLCFQATRLENKINHLEKNKLNEDSLPENDKEFIKNNKLILLSNQKFGNGKNYVFAEEVNKISLNV